MFFYFPSPTTVTHPSSRLKTKLDHTIHEQRTTKSFFIRTMRDFRVSRSILTPTAMQNQKKVVLSSTVHTHVFACFPFFFWSCNFGWHDLDDFCTCNLWTLSLAISSHQPRHTETICLRNFCFLLPLVSK
jgi:hypothetical protein